MTGGFFVIDRGVWDHPGFANETFTELQAWFWLISSAAWEPCKVRVGKATFDLERGQCVFALRFLATKWRWSEPRVRRFLQRRTSDAQTLVRATRQATLITICKYSDYQLMRRTDVAENDAGLNQERRKEEKEITNKQYPCEVAKATRAKLDYSKEFEEAWQVYPRRDGGNPKPPAAKLFLAAVKAGEEPQSIIDGAKRFAITESRNVGTPFIPQMVKWLRDKRWLDYGPGAEIVKFDVRKHML